VLIRDDCFFLGGGADEKVSSVAAGSSAVGLFLFFSSDVLSLDFLEESDIGTEVEVGEFVARACIN
jgi:hypothetical protein